MQILHVCPARVATGGTESIHNFVKELDRVKGVDAKVFYFNVGGDPVPPSFREYECGYVTEIPEGFNGLIIFPEIYANMVLEPRYAGCIRAINWLGTDAYANHTPPAERGAFLQDENVIHLVQSEYAYDFMRKLGVKHIYRNVDVLNKAFLEDYPETERSDVILYNPAKATGFTEILIHECAKNGIRTNPISGLSRTQVIDLMRHSKLYIDFGDFPGRERIPREAVMCGCCIIIGKIGSGGYQADFSIPTQYVFERKLSHIFAIMRRIKMVIGNYEECRKDFETFADIIRDDRRILTHQCEVLVDEVQHYHTSA